MTIIKQIHFALPLPKSSVDLYLHIVSFNIIIKYSPFTELESLSTEILFHKTMSIYTFEVSIIKTNIMKTNNKNIGRANLGLLFIAVGITFILYRLDLIPDSISHVVFSWQMLLIGIGAFNLINKKYTPAIILITIGAIFMVPEIIDIDYSIRRLFWPIALVMVGIVLILRRNKGFEKYDITNIQPGNTDYIDHSSIFGGNKLICNSRNFKGGRVTSIFGGSEVNFQQTKISANTATIDVFTMFGGSKFLVPQGWNVKIDIVSIFGGFNDKRFMTADNQDEGGTLVLKGFAIFGGGDVRN